VVVADSQIRVVLLEIPLQPHQAKEIAAEPLQQTVTAVEAVEVLERLVAQVVLRLAVQEEMVLHQLFQAHR
jgi:hypothetical protein